MIEPCHCRVQQSFNLVNVLISKFYTTVIARRMKPSYTHSRQHKIRWCLQARKVSFLQVPLPDNCVMTPVFQDGSLPLQCTHKHSSPLRQALHTQIRPVARIFRRGVTWMSNLHKHTRLGGSGGMPPRKFLEIRCSEIASEVILGQKHSCASYLARRVLHPIFSCPCMHLLNQLTSNFPDRRYYKVGRTAGTWGNLTKRTTLERLN